MCLHFCNLSWATPVVSMSISTSWSDHVLLLSQPKVIRKDGLTWLTAHGGNAQIVQTSEGIICLYFLRRDRWGQGSFAKQRVKWVSVVRVDNHAVCRSSSHDCGCKEGFSSGKTHKLSGRQTDAVMHKVLRAQFLVVTTRTLISLTLMTTLNLPGYGDIDEVKIRNLNNECAGGYCSSPCLTVSLHCKPYLETNYTSAHAVHDVLVFWHCLKRCTCWKAYSR